MGQLLHGSARATVALRRTIQHSQESIARPAERYDLNAKTVAKWRKRTTVEDAPMGPRQPRSTVLSTKEEAVILAFRRRTLLALDDCLYALLASIPHLTRSGLHRRLQRHGSSRLPEVGGDKPAKKKFAKYAIGYFHLVIAEVHTAQGRLYLFVAIDRTSKVAFAELHLRPIMLTTLPRLCPRIKKASPKSELQVSLAAGATVKGVEASAFPSSLDCTLSPFGSLSLFELWQAPDVDSDIPAS
jgi:transposase-like protein